MQPTALRPPVPRPRYWEKRVLAAYLRMLGATQAVAGKAVARNARRIREWEADATWAQAREEARQRWLGELTDAARVTLLTTLKDVSQGFLALQVLERIDPDLAPAKQQVDVNLQGGGLAALLVRTREDADADDQPAVVRGPRRVS